MTSQLHVGDIYHEEMKAHFRAGNCTQIFASSLFITANNSNVQWANGYKDHGILLSNKKELAVVCRSDEM